MRRSTHYYRGCRQAVGSKKGAFFEPIVLIHRGFLIESTADSNVGTTALVDLILRAMQRTILVSVSLGHTPVLVMPAGIIKRHPVGARCERAECASGERPFC